MEFTKENTLRIMEEIKYSMVDIRNTIENADELMEKIAFTYSTIKTECIPTRNLQK